MGQEISLRNQPANNLPPLSIGQRAQIIHYPGNGPPISIQAVVVRCEGSDCWIDTEYQKSIFVQRKHLEA